jgi:hypothetical protein
MKLVELLPEPVETDSFGYRILRKYLFDYVFYALWDTPLKFTGDPGNLEFGPEVHRKLWEALCAVNVETHSIMAKILELEKPANVR